jgi:squalene-associated FAD-dependent desaturase
VKAQRRIAVIGAGWAGCAAAVELAGAGLHATVFEAARVPGGRARAVRIGPAGEERTVDNGQHIMLGAYAATLALMKKVGVDRDQVLLTLPMQMRYPAAQVASGAGMDFVAPRLPAPLHLAAALLRAKGLAGADKLALARFSTTARWMDWTLHADCSVAELLDRFDQTPRLTALLWRPLCLAALNTPLEQASAKVFLAVLRDSLGARRAASDMLLPAVDLGRLLPDAALHHLSAKGSEVRLGAAVRSLQRDPDGAWLVNGERFDGVVLAVPPPAAAQLLDGLELGDLCAALHAFRYEPITTCYLQYDAMLALPLPFCALLDDPAANRHGQFVFDRGQLNPDDRGLLAVVVSAADAAASLGQDQLAALLAVQLGEAFGRPALATPRWHKVITDKRATFACTAGLVRPANASGIDGLVLAGDYTACDYPATLESAVRSGVAAARLLSVR